MGQLQDLIAERDGLSQLIAEAEAPHGTRYAEPGKPAPDVTRQRIAALRLQRARLTAKIDALMTSDPDHQAKART